MAKITVDELIEEYAVYRGENDYNTKFTLSEFMKFLEYFKKEMEVDDLLDDGVEIFKRFCKRNRFGCYVDKVSNKDANAEDPALIFEYSEEDNDYVIRTCNHLYSSFGASVYSVYWSIEKARRIMGEYLANEPKRTLDDNGSYTEEELQIGKYMSAKIVEDIWESLIDCYVEYKQWPSQCTDINKYLLDMDLAEIIGIKSFKKELLELYKVFSKRIAILYNQDKNLLISYCKCSLLGHQNYKLLINGFEDIVRCAYGEYKNHLEVDLKKMSITKTYEDGASYWDSSAPWITINNDMNNERIKKLLLDLDKCKIKE